MSPNSLLQLADSCVHHGIICLHLILELIIVVGDTLLPVLDLLNLGKQVSDSSPDVRSGFQLICRFLILLLILVPKIMLLS